jgi:hypothetical protein
MWGDDIDLRVAVWSDDHMRQIPSMRACRVLRPVLFAQWVEVGPGGQKIWGLTLTHGVDMKGMPAWWELRDLPPDEDAGSLLL